ncbi:PREDICTED: trihelix transcription factor GT-3a [Tarenaya hassleriana]|uniref:trihelix transcription factor GT-3a n=1 Tax=Tarenaya hassleriana TaxID=28532 RepID=UPI00053C5AC8|nr:PREDICTED: trihelix transcription factor GT-3a [Tarenaya hassleriana]
MDRHNPYQHHHHQLHHQQQLQHLPAVDLSGGGGERIPQWSVQETEELLRIREELDQTFMETKRNKLLWEVVASKMSDKGFVRTADQCKSKWKNLVTRFKGCETTEPEAMRKQFPFYNEIQTIFSARMQRMLWSDTAEASTSKRKPQISSDDDEEDEDEDDPEHEINDELLSLVETHQKGTTVMTSNPRKRAKKAKGETPTTTTSGSSVKEVLEEFMRQMVKTEKEWREACERRERERERREREWRRRMAELEEERVAAERRWMEKEEERRVREEVRAQKRDLLIDALLTRLNTDHHRPSN